MRTLVSSKAKLLWVTFFSTTFYIIIVDPGASDAGNSRSEETFTNDEQGDDSDNQIRLNIPKGIKDHKVYYYSGLSMSFYNILKIFKRVELAKHVNRRGYRFTINSTAVQHHAFPRSNAMSDMMRRSPKSSLNRKIGSAISVCRLSPRCCLVPDFLSAFHLF